MMLWSKVYDNLTVLHLVLEKKVTLKLRID